jgi:heparanase
LMGATVLDAGASPAANLHVYAQCLEGHPGGVALLAINADRTAAQELKVPVRSERYTLTAAKLMDTAVELNGKTLTVNAEGNVPSLAGAKEKAGKVMLAPESITFLAMPAADNQSCR